LIKNDKRLKSDIFQK